MCFGMVPKTFKHILHFVLTELHQFVIDKILGGASQRVYNEGCEAKIHLYYISIFPVPQ